jgi:hypothetical protein
MWPSAVMSTISQCPSITTTSEPARSVSAQRSRPGGVAASISAAVGLGARGPPVREGEGRGEVVVTPS